MVQNLRLKEQSFLVYGLGLSGICCKIFKKNNLKFLKSGTINQKLFKNIE